MTLAPLLNASPVIQAHAFAALAALALGAAQLAAPKGALPHRAMGWTWVILMMGVAGTSLFTLAIVPLGLMRARRHDVRAHRAIMIWTYCLALIAAGLLTLAPGRIMHAVVFGN